MIEVTVAGLGVRPPSSIPLLLLKERAGERVLLIGIGPLEAQAIALPLQGVQPPRPLTHDILLEAIDRLGGRPQRAEIVRLDGGTFFARLLVEQPTQGTTIDFDIRPSDAVGLAVRSGIPILVAEAVMDEAGILAEIDDPGAASGEGEPEEAESEVDESKLTPFREFIETLDLDDLDPDPGERRS